VLQIIAKSKVAYSRTALMVPSVCAFWSNGVLTVFEVAVCIRDSLHKGKARRKRHVNMGWHGKNGVKNGTL
jgi:hypothetical protein